MSNTLKNDNLAVWALEMVYADGPSGRHGIARGWGSVAIQKDGTVWIEAEDARSVDDDNRPFRLRLTLRTFEDVLELVEEAPHLLGAATR
jgi:hypothetical protein